MMQFICHSAQSFRRLLTVRGPLPLSWRGKNYEIKLQSEFWFNRHFVNKKCLQAVWSWGEIRLLNCILFTFMKCYSLTLSWGWWWMEERRHSLALLPSSRSPRAALPSPELLAQPAGKRNPLLWSAWRADKTSTNAVRACWVNFAALQPRWETAGKSKTRMPLPAIRYLFSHRSQSRFSAAARIWGSFQKPEHERWCGLGLSSCKYDQNNLKSGIYRTKAFSLYLKNKRLPRMLQDDKTRTVKESFVLLQHSEQCKD